MLFNDQNINLDFNVNKSLNEIIKQQMFNKSYIPFDFKLKYQQKIFKNKVNYQNDIKVGFSKDTTNDETKSQRILFSQHKNCQHCKFQLSFQIIMVQKALYVKYASSQNYFYSKDPNEILANIRSKNVFKFKDNLVWDDEELQQIKQYFQIDEGVKSLETLTEYYKFHNEIPRLFMLPITKVINKYHDKHRNIMYVQIQNFLNQQNNNNNKINYNIDQNFKNPQIENYSLKPQDRLLQQLGIQSILTVKSFKDDSTINEILKLQDFQKIESQNVNQKSNVSIQFESEMLKSSSNKINVSEEQTFSQFIENAPQLNGQLNNNQQKQQEDLKYLMRQIQEQDQKIKNQHWNDRKLLNIQKIMQILQKESKKIVKKCNIFLSKNKKSFKKANIMKTQIGSITQRTSKKQQQNNNQNKYQKTNQNIQLQSSVAKRKQQNFSYKKITANDKKINSEQKKINMHIRSFENGVQSPFSSSRQSPLINKQNALLSAKYKSNDQKLYLKEFLIKNVYSKQNDNFDNEKENFNKQKIQQIINLSNSKIQKEMNLSKKNLNNISQQLLQRGQQKHQFRQMSLDPKINPYIDSSKEIYSHQIINTSSNIKQQNQQISNSKYKRIRQRSPYLNIEKQQQTKRQNSQKLKGNFFNNIIILKSQKKDQKKYIKNLQQVSHKQNSLTTRNQVKPRNKYKYKETTNLF